MSAAGNVRRAEVSVAGSGTKGGPFSLPLAELGPLGYRADEFFIRGTAVSYRLATGTTAGPDGRWEAEETDEADYVTRILVVRPTDASAFNGHVVVHWQNVTAGYELGTADDPELLSGWAWVGVSAQRVGIHGFPPGAAPYRGRQAPQRPLKEWDPERYAELDHPGDQWSFDIFTQAARAVGPDRQGPVDPLGGLTVDRVVAAGASQSASRLTTYINAVHPLVGVFDGFLPTITSGRGTHLNAPAPTPTATAPGAAATAASAATPAAMAARLGVATRTRDDIDTPVFIVNSECEAVGMYGSRRDDDDHFRFWEVAGAPHVVAVVPADRPEGMADNPLTYRPVVSAAYQHLRSWMGGGAPPPAQPRIEFETDGSGSPTIKRDEHGNAVGGIRLPEMEAALAEYRGRDDTAEGLGTLYGWARPFPSDEVARLYPSPEAYRKVWEEAVDHLLATGTLRSVDGPDYRQRGAEVADTLAL